MKLYVHFAHSVNCEYGTVIYLGSNISFAESNVNKSIVKPLATIDCLMTIRKSDRSDKMKKTSSNLLDRLDSNESIEEKNLDVDYKSMLCVVLNKCWEQFTTKKQLYSHLLPISLTIHVRRARRASEVRMK